MFKTHKYFLPSRQENKEEYNQRLESSYSHIFSAVTTKRNNFTHFSPNQPFSFSLLLSSKKIQIRRLRPQMEPTSLAFVYYQQWRLENLQTLLHSCTEGKENERAWRKINEILGLHAYSHWVRRVHSVRDSELAGFDDTAWSGFFTEVGYLSCGLGFASIYITWHVFSLTLLQTL